MAQPDDFKSSARPMLEALRNEKSRLSERLKELEDREAVILKWIEAEEGPQQQLPLSSGRVPLVRRRIKPTMTEVFREVMQDGRPRTNEELGELVRMRGIVDGNVDLRSVNATMMSLMKTGEFLRRDHKWIRRAGN
ncbi:MAG TPA: hypothetical protein VF934_03335 [Burkholderiales bacterium]